MYTEGQTLKITATAYNRFKIAEGKSFIVSVLDTVGAGRNIVYVQLSANDAGSPDFRANRRGVSDARHWGQLSIVFKAIAAAPTFYPDWAIEIVKDAPDAQTCY